MGISRRAVLGGIGQSAALGAMAASLSAQLRAAQPAAAAPKAPAAPAAPAPTYCQASIYRPAEGVAFNADMFRDQHLPLLKKVYGTSVDRIELRTPNAVAEGAPPPQIIGTVNIWFHDVAAFSNKTKTGGAEVAASLANVSKAPMIGQVDQIIAVLGEDRLTVPVDSLCVSTYFPAKEGATFDAKYFAGTFYPKMLELYGTAAIRRIEVSSGAVGPANGKPVVMHSAHVYIRDEAAYDEAAAKSGTELGAEAQKYTNIQPFITVTRLYAVG